MRPQEISVVCDRGQQTAELLPRKKVRRLGGWEAGFCSCHLLANPASRRPGRKEFGILMEDLRAGRLKTACDALAEKFAASGATYKDCEPTLLPLAGSLGRCAILPHEVPALAVQGGGRRSGAVQGGLARPGRHGIRLREGD